MKKNKRKSITTRKPKIIVSCGSCSQAVESDSEDPAIQCDTCNKWTHGDCSGLSPGDIKKLLNDSKHPFSCKPCKRKATSFAPSSSLTSQFSQSQFEMIMSRFDEMAEIKSDTVEIKKTVEFLSNMINDTDQKCDKLSKDFKNMVNENNDLRRTVNSQNVRLNALENLRLRSQCFLRIPSPRVDKETIIKEVVDAIVAIGVPLEERDIKSAMVQQKMNNEHSSIIKIEFKEEEKKFQLMKNKSKLKDLPQYKDCSFFDVLSRSAADLFKYTKLLKECGYKFIYHRTGKIFAKKTEQSQPILILNKQKVDELLHGNLAMAQQVGSTPNSMSSGRTAERRSKFIGNPSI